MKVIKNCKILSERYEEYPMIQIRYDDEVFVDLPLCVIEFGQVLKKPVLYANGNSIPQAVELSDLMVTLSKLKKFFVKVEEQGKVVEVPEGEETLVLRLPKDTNINDIFYIDGQIIRRSLLEVKDNGAS